LRVAALQVRNFTTRNAQLFRQKTARRHFYGVNSDKSKNRFGLLKESILKILFLTLRTLRLCGKSISRKDAKAQRKSKIL
jgi:hypothetical protein